MEIDLPARHWICPGVKSVKPKMNKKLIKTAPTQLEFSNSDCPPGGIGRRAGFRYPFPRKWEFKSPQPHLTSNSESNDLSIPPGWDLNV